MNFKKIKRKDLLDETISFFEKTLALIVLVGVFVYGISVVDEFLHLDWSSQDTFYYFIYQLLLIIIGLELARMLLAHSFLSIIELLGFVVARKLLKPDTEILEIALGIAAFVLLVAAYRYLVCPVTNKLKNEKGR